MTTLPNFCHWILSVGSILFISLPIQAIPPKISIDLSDRDRQILEQLVNIAQHNAATIKTAQADLGFSSLGDSLILEISPTADSNGSTSVSLTFNPLEAIGVLQHRPALRAKLQEATRQKRVEVMQAYFTYLQAKQTQAIAKYRVDSYRRRSHPDPDYFNLAHELFIANNNQRLTLETLATVVGQPVQNVLKLVR